MRGSTRKPSEWFGHGVEDRDLNRVINQIFLNSLLLEHIIINSKYMRVENLISKQSSIVERHHQLLYMLFTAKLSKIHKLSPNTTRLPRENLEHRIWIENSWD